MNTILEEIRRRIKAASDNTDEAGDYDEYATGQGVGLATALRIIDEVDKEHPVPSDVEAAAHKAYPVDILGDVHHPRLMIDRNQTKRESFIEGMLAERERLMKDAIDAQVMIPIPSTAYIKEQNLHDLRKYIVDNFNHGDKVSVIIIKKE